jgi:ribonuclease BN (tRNA processing enzyme)
VAHNAVPEGASGLSLELHMPPSLIGRIAKAANVKALVLSHRMLRTLGHEAETPRVIASAWSGPTAFADDLDCFR